jgi:hypothetical protein
MPIVSSIFDTKEKFYYENSSFEMSLFVLLLIYEYAYFSDKTIYPHATDKGCPSTTPD